jgi:hypothetical protein
MYALWMQKSLALLKTQEVVTIEDGFSSQQTRTGFCDTFLLAFRSWRTRATQVYEQGIFSVRAISNVNRIIHMLAEALAWAIPAGGQSTGYALISAV